MGGTYELNQINFKCTLFGFRSSTARLSRWTCFLEALSCWATTTCTSTAAARFLRSLLAGSEAHLPHRSRRRLVPCVAYGTQKRCFLFLMFVPSEPALLCL